jgi:catechol 2,3-dioxygenase-like lactoylglutathione lyase family enzyme
MMIQAPLGHFGFNVKPENLPFYRDLMTFLGWQVSHDGEGMLMVESANGEMFGFIGSVKDVTNDYDGPGLNHIAFAAASVADVDTAVDYLKAHSVEPLFETPRHRPDFVGDPDQTYYQVMFETPDRILLEIVYAGPV